MEITINLKTGDKVPMYEQIYEYIRDEIRNARSAVIWTSAEAPLNWHMNSFCQRDI